MRTYQEIKQDVYAAYSVNSAADMMRYAQELDDLQTTEATALASRVRGRAAIIRGDYATALESYRTALALFESLGDQHEVASVLGNIGSTYQYTGDYPLALEHLFKSLALHETRGDAYGIAIASSNIGTVYSRIGENDAALERYHSALEVYEQMGDTSNAATVNGNIGIIYNDAGDYAKALEYYRRALAVHEAVGDIANAERITGNMATALINAGEYDNASELLDLHHPSTITSPAVRSTHYVSRAKIAAHNGELDEAWSMLLNALEIASAAGARRNVAECHLTLRYLAQQRNDFAAYIEHNDAYHGVMEEIRGKEATQKMAMIEAERRMEAERRDREKERALLYGALPKAVADRMIRGEDVTSDQFDHAAVLFIDVVDFTSHTATMHPADVVRLLDEMFHAIDAICALHDVIKIKTIGDSYLCFRGDADAHANARSIAQVALDVMHVAFTWPHGGRVQLRIGAHIGPATAGVIGSQRLQYDVWGDTVNVASRMESTGEPGRIHVSDTFAQHLTADSMTSIPRGVVDIKGKGAMQTFWLT